FLDQKTRQPAARNCHITAAGQFQKDACTEATDASASFIDDPHLSDVISDSVDLIAKPHALGYVIAKAPKIDDITSLPECCAGFNHCGLKSTRPQPEGERWPGHSQTRNQNRFSAHIRKLASTSALASSRPASRHHQTRRSV